MFGQIPGATPLPIRPIGLRRADVIQRPQIFGMDLNLVLMILGTAFVVFSFGRQMVK